MESKHTPGPWCISRDGTPDYAPQYTVYDEEPGDRVATAFVSEANAALIAAAPELLEALEEAHNALELFASDESQSGQIAVFAVMKARAAIAKASGSES